MEDLDSVVSDQCGITLVERLQKTRDSSETGDADTGAEITDLLTHAVHDPNPSYTLRDIVHALSITGTSSEADPLHVVPLLIEAEDPATDEVLSLLAECGNAKETVIAVQESLEKLHHDLVSSDELRETKAALRLERVFRLYIGAIPRLKLRKRSASETLKPLFADAVPVLEAVGGSLKQSERNTLVELGCNLITSAVSWSSIQGNGEDHDQVKVELCRSILSESAAMIRGTNIGLQKFESLNPRLFQRQGQADSAKDALLRECYNVALLVSYTVEKLLQERTTGAVVLLSIFLSRTSSTSSIPSPNSLLEAVFPALIAALQSNTSMDATLNILLHVLYPPNPNAPTSIDPDYIPPLSSALASTASTSPDPRTRLIAFHILGALLSRASPLEHMTLLRDLLVETPFLQMRVAAVGLLKNAVLDALRPNAGASPFASPDMLRSFGYIVLRPDPPDLFSKPATRASLESLMETQEPKRLVECLSFYYVLLMRDERNVTGIRDSSQIKSTERELLSPLRDALNTWAELDDIETVGEHAGMALAAIQTSLERIDEAYEKLVLKLS